MRLVALVFGATLVVCGSAHPQSSGPVLEASGWTPVRSSQVPLRLPQEYLEQQQQQQQRGPEDLGQPARGEQDRQVIAYAPEDAGDYAVPPQEGPQDISVTVENQQDVRDVHTDNGFVPSEQQHNHENHLHNQEHHAQEVLSPSPEANNVKENPLIVYPANSIQTVQQEDDVAVQTALPDVQNGYNPQRPPPPNQGGYQRFPRPPPPRFRPAGLPRVPPRRVVPQQALPRNDPQAFPTEGRQLPPQQRAPPPPPQGQGAPPPGPPQRPPQGPPPGRRPPPPPRRRPRPRPRPGILDTISNAGNKVKCAAENVLSDVKLNDEAFMQAQLGCVLDEIPCDQTGIQIKRLAPEVMRGICPNPCDECKVAQIRKVMSHISQKYPKQWNKIWRLMGNRDRNRGPPPPQA